MKLAALIRENALTAPATAIPAIPAIPVTEPTRIAPAVARIATIALATSPSENPAFRQWRISYPNAAAMNVLFTPEAMFEEVREVYRGAAIEPIAEARKCMPTLAEAEELRTLIADVLREESDAERTDALAVACADPDASLLSLRALVADHNGEAHD